MRGSELDKAFERCSRCCMLPPFLPCLPCSPPFTMRSFPPSASLAEEHHARIDVLFSPVALTLSPPPAASLTEEHHARIDALFSWLVDPCMAFIRKNCKELVQGGEGRGGGNGRDGAWRRGIRAGRGVNRISPHP